MPVLPTEVGASSGVRKASPESCSSDDSDSAGRAASVGLPRLHAVRVVEASTRLAPRMTPRLGTGQQRAMSPRPRVLPCTEAAKCCETSEFTIDDAIQHSLRPHDELIAERNASRERAGLRDVFVRSGSKERLGSKEAAARSSSLSRERAGSKGWSTWLSPFSRQTSQSSTSSKDSPACDNAKSFSLSRGLRKSSKSSTCSKNSSDLEQLPHPAERAKSDEAKKPACAAPVTLHVYNTSWIGGVASGLIHAVHLGIEVYCHEFAFGHYGVRTFKPGKYDVPNYCCSLHLGMTSLRPAEVYQLLLSMREEYPPDRYRIIGCNCQTFAVAFSERLGLSSDCIPQEYLSFAKPWTFAGGLDAMDMIPQSLQEWGASNLPFGFTSCLPGPKTQAVTLIVKNEMASL